MIPWETYQGENNSIATQKRQPTDTSIMTIQQQTH